MLVRCWAGLVSGLTARCLLILRDWIIYRRTVDLRVGIYCWRWYLSRGGWNRSWAWRTSMRRIWIVLMLSSDWAGVLDRLCGLS